MEPKANIIVKVLKFNKTISAKKHKKITQNKPSFVDIFPEAIGLFLVLKTFLSNSLSRISFTIHPAERISTEPKKNKVRYKNNDEVKVDAVAFAKNNPYSLGDYNSLNNMKLFEDFVNYLKLNKVDVTLFLPPYNPIAFDLLIESNKYKQILKKYSSYMMIIKM